MKYHLAQLNIAEFIEDIGHPNNKEFVDNLDRINGIAEQSDGFVWRLVGDGNSAIDIRPFDDPKIAVNMSVWESRELLYNFVYRNPAHVSFIKRRREWFKKMRFYLVLWWIPEGSTPTIEEVKQRLCHLRENGPSRYAFTFAQFYSCEEFRDNSKKSDDEFG